MKASRTQQLLERVTRRQRWAGFGRRFQTFFLACAGVYLLLLLVSRLLALVPFWFTPLTLAVPLVVALVLAILFHARPGMLDAARAVDAVRGNKDLFLTAATIDHTLGAYQEVVLADAERQAAGVRPPEVVRFDWQRGAASVLGMTLALLVAVWWVPQLDPFGREQVRQQANQQRRRLQETVRATDLRRAMLRQPDSRTQAEKVQQALTELRQTFNTAVPTNRVGTLGRLNEHQKELGKLWRQANTQQTPNAGAVSQANQRFGLGDPAKAAQWKADLQRGDASSVKRELSELQDLARKLAQTADPLEREKLRRQLADQLRSLADTLGQQANSPALQEALQRALEQLQMAGQQPLSAEALDALQQSLELSAEELEQLAQSMQDVQQLEEALQALQAAKRANDAQGWDGGQAGACRNMAEYCALFNSLCRGPGLIPGMGEGGGPGVGPREYGDESLPNRFESERSPSTLQAGKVLLQWETRDVSTPGEAQTDYRQAVGDVRQQASEAVVKEQVPPAYHSAIKQYFDRLGESTPAPAHE